MTDKSELWIKRADEMLAKGISTNRDLASELAQSAVSMLADVYGQNSPQIHRFLADCDVISKRATGSPAPDICRHARGAIASAKGELQAGLTVRLRTAVTGEVLSELTRLGKEILSDQSEGSKNVAAVLIAAAFEDLIRRMGAEFASVIDRPKLEEVIGALKKADVLRGGEVGTAQSYLKFRNDSLHADWQNVSRSQVESCAAFIESLLVKHFS